jgi:DNA repair exonuclease SbcCD ATPase subunit
MRLSKELLALKQYVDNITAKESAIKNNFDELAVVYTGFAEQLAQVESVTRQTAEAASADSKREEETYHQLEREKSEIRSQLRDKEETLQVREVAIKDLNEKLQSISEELDRKTAELAKLSEFRDVTLGSLRAAREALSGFTRSVNALEGPEVAFVDNPEGDQQDADAAKLKELQDLQNLKEDMQVEIDKLQAANREKDVLFRIKATENEITKQGLEARVKELEDVLSKRQGKRKTTDFVSYLVDIGKKH